MKVINLLGSPSAGKSTAMLGLTYMMKMMGLSVEHTPEFFKELVLEDSNSEKFGGQLYILGEQNRRLARLLGKNDFAVTDCPLPLIGYYTPQNYIEGFDTLVKNLYHQYNNVNYFIIRNHEFESGKRIHDESASDKIANELPEYFLKNGITYKVMKSGPDLVDRILDDLIKEKVITYHHLMMARNPEVRKKYCQEQENQQ